MSQNYKSVDSVVDNYSEKFKSIKQFAKQVNSDFDSDIDKIRAAYYWVSNNIEFDYAQAKKGNSYKIINYKSKARYEYELNLAKRRYAEKSLTKKKTICEGYAQILKFTYAEFGIESETITGFVKTLPNEIGEVTENSNHVWNAVKLNNEWHLIDATWSTGNKKDRPGIFNFSDEYFFIAPEEMALTHSPENNEWQLLARPITKNSYFYKPLFYNNYFNSKMVLNSKVKGLIKVKPNNSIVLEFDSIDESKTYYYSFKENKDAAQPIIFNKNNDKFYANITFSKNNADYLALSNDDGTIAEFKIIVSSLAVN